METFDWNTFAMGLLVLIALAGMAYAAIHMIVSLLMSLFTSN